MKNKISFLNILVFFFSISFTLIFLELTFRVFDIRGYHSSRKDKYSTYRPSPPLNNVRYLFQPNSIVQYEYDSNPRNYFDKNNRIFFQLNNQGFRGPDFFLEKKSTEKRILFLGDSFTVGEGVRYEDTFVSQTGIKLNKKSNIEVINLGVSGWSTVEEMEYFVNSGIYLNPDLVLVVYVLNDAFPGVLDIFDKFRASYENSSFKNSFLISFIYSRLAKKFQTKDYIQNMLASTSEHSDMWQLSFDQLLKGKKMADQFNVKFAVVLFPFMYELSEKYPFRKLHETITQFCNSNGIQIYDLFPNFKGQKDIDLWVHPSDQHPNEKAHKIAAEGIIRFINSKDLLKNF